MILEIIYIAPININI